MNDKAEVKKALLGAYFHGEYWIICPHCGRNFEYYDAVYEREGIKKLKRTYILVNVVGDLKYEHC